MFADMVARAPPGTQAASLDITKAYRCSPIAPLHKPFIPLFWRGYIWPDHCAPFGLTTAGNIQGELADATIDILATHNIPHVVKWVDNFDFLCHPVSSSLVPNGSIVCSYSFDLKTTLDITAPLGIPWYDVSEQGHDFAFETNHSGFVWALPNKQVTKNA